ncbi:MAG: YfiR/HmsC family protein [Gemmatimonas sp.]
MNRFTALAIAVACAISSIASREAFAQEMEIPVSLQIPLFLKVISFDRQRVQDDPTLVVGVAFQSGFRLSSVTRDDAERAFRGAGDRRVKVVPIDLDVTKLGEALAQHQVSVLYVAPLRAYNVRSIAEAASAAHATTITGVSQYVTQGLSVSARLQSERPKLLINLSAARKGGANFAAELLKLAEVVE